jgi:hypothetical protein
MFVYVRALYVLGCPYAYYYSVTPIVTSAESANMLEILLERSVKMR